MKEAMISRLLPKLIHRINATTHFFIMTTSQQELGNTANEIYTALIYCRRHRKKLLVLRLFQVFKFPKTANKELYQIRSPYMAKGPAPVVQYLGNLILTLLYGHIPVTFKYLTYNLTGLLKYKFSKSETFKFTKRWNFYENIFLGYEFLWNPSLAKSFSWEEAEKIDWNEEYLKPLELSLDIEKSEKAKAALATLGLKPTDWYTCLHVREGGYGNDPHSLRNCHIENYFDGIKAITARGGWVIRLGDPTMTPLPKMERVIDYPFTPFKSEFMDLYLIKNCKYYIGQNSGPYDIARLFNKKLIMINSTDLITAVPLARGELIIPKHFYLKAEQRYLSLKEVLAGPNSLIDLWVFDNEKYDLIENRPHEIRDVIVETLDNEGKDIKYSATQIEFLKARKEQIKRVFAENPYMVNASRLPFDLEGWNLNLKFRIASQTSSCEGSIGRTYAAKNWDNDELNLGADAKAPPNFQSL